eukprot:Nk52_evm86s164 gene=Nk52_evmTU86s164
MLEKFYALLELATGDYGEQLLLTNIYSPLQECLVSLCSILQVLDKIYPEQFPKQQETQKQISLSLTKVFSQCNRIQKLSRYYSVKFRQGKDLKCLLPLPCTEGKSQAEYLPQLELFPLEANGHCGPLSIFNVGFDSCNWAQKGRRKNLPRIDPSIMRFCILKLIMKEQI